MGQKRKHRITSVSNQKDISKAPGMSDSYYSREASSTVPTQIGPPTGAANQSSPHGQADTAEGSGEVAEDTVAERPAASSVGARDALASG